MINIRDITLTKIKASRYLQVGTLAKVIDGRDSELVAGFLSKVADGDLC